MTNLATLAQTAFSNHIPAGFSIQKLEQTESDAVVEFTWRVEYPDGKQISGTVDLSEDNSGYSICITEEYTPNGAWSFPHTWEYGYF